MNMRSFLLLFALIPGVTWSAVYSGASSLVPLDLTEGTRTITTAQELTYSTAWETEEEGAVATIAVNGETLGSASGEGTTDWTPTKIGTNVLTHIVMTNGVQIGEVLTATFDVLPTKEIVNDVEWAYLVVSNQAWIFEFEPSDVTSLVIPASLGGCPVTKIDSQALAGLASDTPIAYNYDYAAEWKPVFASCGFTNLLAYTTVPRTEVVEGVEWVFLFTNSQTCVVGVEPTTVTSLNMPSDLGGFSVTEIGNGAIANCSDLASVTIPNTIKHIGNDAFSGCVALENLEIPEGVETIGDRAFKDCTWMQKISLPMTLRTIGTSAFENCSSLYPGVTIPEGVKTLGASAFSNCWQMVSVSLPSSLDDVGEGAFKDCRHLTGATVPTHIQPMCEMFPSAYANLESIAVSSNEVQMCEGVFSNCTALIQMTIPRSVSHISGSAFNGCSKLEKVILPEGLLSIGSEAFVGCETMDDPVLPDSVVSIGARAFKGLSQFTRFEFPSSLERIGEEAFSDCTGLFSVDLPDGLVSLDAKAFYGVTKLTQGVIPGTVTNLGAAVFGNCPNIKFASLPGGFRTASDIYPDAYAKLTSAVVSEGTETICASLFKNCGCLASVSIPSSVTNIGDYAFANCVVLPEIGIPSGVKRLGVGAFQGCSSLSSLALPQGLCEIGDDTFNGCASLMEIVIPDSVMLLGARVFSGCSSLATISYLGDAPSYGAATYSGTAATTTSRVIKGTTGWDGIAGSKALPETWPTSNSRAITYWNADVFQVLFLGNGGTPETNSIDQVTGLTYVLPLVDPVRAGARFDGWWTEVENGAQIKVSSKVTATRAHELYAHWRMNQYKVIFDAMEGIGEMSDLTLTYGTSSQLPMCAFVKENADFSGWAVEPNGPVVYDDGASVQDLTLTEGEPVALYAVWTAREWTPADYLNAKGLEFTLEGDADWVPDQDVSHDGFASMRSGALSAAETGGCVSSKMRTTILGQGTGSFWWKVDCEPAGENEGEIEYYDNAVFTIDGKIIAQIAGVADWTKVEYSVVGGGAHVLEWSFSRDDWDEEGSVYENAAWVDELVWSPISAKITFDAGGAEGELPESLTVQPGEQVVVPNAQGLSCEGKTFAGWTDGENTYMPGDVLVSDEADLTLTAVWIVKTWSLEDAVNVTNLTLTTGGDANWTVDLTESHDGEASLKSGTVTTSQSTWLEARISGSGTLSFAWKAAGYTYRGSAANYVQCLVDGATVSKVAVCAWTNVCLSITGAGEHVIRWSYTHTRAQSSGSDCAWLDELVWLPVASGQVTIPADVTGGKSIDISESWVDEDLVAKFGAGKAAAFRAKFGDDLSAAVLKKTGKKDANGNELAVWQDYVAGTDPTDEKSQFTASVSFVNGKPVITWSPALNGEGVKEGVRVYRTFGAKSLTSAFEEVKAGTEAAYQFFKVTVEMP